MLIDIINAYSPTFYRIYQKKSTEGFQSLPYVVALFSCLLWIYYAFVKTDTVLLITINSFGCFIETVYITLYLIYAPKKARMFTLQIFILLNVVTFGLIVLLTQLLATGSRRVTRLVIRTKSVEFMPFYLSFFLTLSAIAWFGYGLFTKDLYVELPNVLGFLFGVAQMILYIIYKKKGTAKIEKVTSTAANSEMQFVKEEKQEGQVGKMENETKAAEEDNCPV
ncbi:hypothetical protein Cni_G24676 [Canna indica]|uniref:Sugar transporter SWEET1 n=1 Tax=Canna indica TaxID=4628 RepID=A0AAQ3KWD3_9LILI|nr:hypothetical protein Cni_G24676 [Canna indica]